MKRQEKNGHLAITSSVFLLTWLVRAKCSQVRMGLNTWHVRPYPNNETIDNFDSSLVR